MEWDGCVCIVMSSKLLITMEPDGEELRTEMREARDKVNQIIGMKLNVAYVVMNHISRIGSKENGGNEDWMLMGG